MVNPSQPSFEHAERRPHYTKLQLWKTITFCRFLSLQARKFIRKIRSYFNLKQPDLRPRVECAYSNLPDTNRVQRQ
jgi:hypothetical protein